MDWYDKTLKLIEAGERVTEPPCRGCRYFAPRLDVHPSRPNSFWLCQTQFGQYKDFSCFEPKDAPDGS